MTWHEQKLSNERECYSPFPGLAGGSLEYEVIISEVQHAKSTSFDKETIFPSLSGPTSRKVLPYRLLQLVHM